MRVHVGIDDSANKPSICRSAEVKAAACAKREGREERGGEEEFVVNVKGGQCAGKGGEKEMKRGVWVWQFLVIVC